MISLAPLIDALRRTASSARAARAAFASKVQSFPTLSSSQAAITQDTLVHLCSPPPPQPISADLVQLGLRPVPAEKISSAYERTASKYKTVVEEQYVAALKATQESAAHDVSRWKKTASLFANTLVTQYLKALESWRSTIIDRVGRRVRELRDVQLSRSTLSEERKSFNASATPVLEKFFARNPRPSRTEKQQLAIQTNMDYKQISVWFQNRRNRSKKEEVVVTSSDTSGDSPLPPDLAAALARILDHWVVPEGGGAYDQRDGLLDLAASFAPFHANRPEHSWPACYPPLFSDDPFPPSRDARQLSIPWYRTPVRSPASHAAPDESELLALLKKWRLSSDSTEPDRKAHRRPNMLPMNPSICLPSVSSVPRSSSAASCNRDMSSPGWAACASTSCASQQMVCPPVSTKVEARSPGPLRLQVASISVNDTRRRRTARLGPLRDSLPMGDSKTFGKPFVGISPSAMRSWPYPKVDLSKEKVIQWDVYTSPRQWYTRRHPSPTSDMVSARSPEIYVKSPSSPPTALPALSRELSVDSSRSVSSSRSASSSPSVSSSRSVSTTSRLTPEPELLLTPLSSPISSSVLDYPVPDYPAFDLSDYASEDPFKCLAIDEAPRAAAYLGYSVAWGGHDPALAMSSALYSQLEPAPFIGPSLIPSFSSSVLVL